MAKMSCYAATVANLFYDQWKGCKLDCVPSKTGREEHTHWWNEPQGRQGGTGSSGQQPDYCEDPDFEPPTPLGHQAWSLEPGETQNNVEGGTSQDAKYGAGATFQTGE
ncbi:hypothetical protein J6590_059483 [Homalodisca vitripennis]|nr:hypothetical protein J6590_059483 [Homalodisca vitripennis]